jgi:hypothetical protein
VTYYPTDAHLLNYRGYVAARMGDYGTAVYDFRVGQRITGSVDGIFENNIAWSTLYQLDSVEPQRADRVLLEARGLYRASLEKNWSCERVHTGMFVEYAIADNAARTYGADDPRVAEAVERYVPLFYSYASCWDRIDSGDELVVEELLAAAAMDAKMGELAGVPTPTRHVGYARLSVQRGEELGLAIDAAFCERSVPVKAAVATCVEFTK